jgi:hypothetical protein
VANPALFRQAFAILCRYPAQEISYTKLRGQLQDKGNTDLIKYYIELYAGAVWCLVGRSREVFSHPLKGQKQERATHASPLIWLSVVKQTKAFLSTFASGCAVLQFPEHMPGQNLLLRR